MISIYVAYLFLLYVVGYVCVLCLYDVVFGDVGWGICVYIECGS